MIVTHTLDIDKPISAESLERLRKIAEMPDDQIRTDLIPELPAEAWKRAIRNPWAKILREQATRKAS